MCTKEDLDNSLTCSLQKLHPFYQCFLRTDCSALHRIQVDRKPTAVSVRGFNCHQNAQGWNRNSFFSMRKNVGRVWIQTGWIIFTFGIFAWYLILELFSFVFLLSKEREWGVSRHHLSAAPPWGQSIYHCNLKSCNKRSFFGHLIPYILYKKPQNNPGIFISMFANSFCFQKRGDFYKLTYSLEALLIFSSTWSQDKT